MITVRTMGGLGNQMFQYAFGLAQANRLRTKLQIDNTSNRLDSSRPFNLNLFQVPESVVQGASGRLNRERIMGFDPAFEAQDGDLLVGYWQSEKYFESVASSVRERFRSANSIWSAEATQFAAKIFCSRFRSVALGIRRTDYVHNPRTQAFHGNLDLNYYIEALNAVRSKVDVDPIVFVFSDDIEWVKKNWNFGYETYYWDGDKTVSGHIGREDIDIGLMSLCVSSIIPNSSFAWWGAWLGDYMRDGVVVAPKKWFADETANSQATMTICPERWVRI